MPSLSSRRAIGRLSTRNSTSNPLANTRCRRRMTSSSWQTASARTINDYMGVARVVARQRTGTTRHATAVESTQMPHFRGVWLVAVSSVLMATTTIGRQQAPFQATVDLVSLPVVVLDRDGTPVRRLGPDDFEIFENGRRQVVSSFVEGAVDAAPLHLGLMLD